MTDTAIQRPGRPTRRHTRPVHSTASGRRRPFCTTVRCPTSTSFSFPRKIGPGPFTSVVANSIPSTSGSPRSRRRKFEFRIEGPDGKPIPANSNAGHGGMNHTQIREGDSNRDFTDTERRALIEF